MKLPKKVAVVPEICISVEFLMTAARASSSGYPLDSEEVSRPLKWAVSKLNDILNTAKPPK